MIETKRLMIRRFNKDDWKDLYEYLSDEDVIKYEPYDVFTEEGCRQEAVERSNKEAFWAVCLKDTKPLKLIGNIYLAEQEYGTWELGYVFNAGYHGKGYATEAAEIVIDHVIAKNNARRIVAMCNPLNEASWKLMERLKMRREGHLIKNIYFKYDGQGQPIWSDTYEYGILAEEWTALHRDGSFS